MTQLPLTCDTCGCVNETRPSGLSQFESPGNSALYHEDFMSGVAERSRCSECSAPLWGPLNAACHLSFKEGRIAAAVILAEFGGLDAFGPLGTLLVDRDADVQAAALRAAVVLGSRPAAHLAHELWEHASDRRQAARIGPQEAEGVDDSYVVAAANGLYDACFAALTWADPENPTPRDRQTSLDAASYGFARAVMRPLLTTYVALENTTRALQEDASSQPRTDQADDVRKAAVLATEGAKSYAGFVAMSLEGTVVPVLADALSDLNDETRVAVAELLGVTGRPEAVQPLIAATHDEDSIVRVGAAWGLGNLASADAVGPLVDLLNDIDNDWVVGAAATALGQIGDSTALSAIRRALDLLPGDSPFRDVVLEAVEDLEGS